MDRRNEDRHYGFFRCTKCRKTWESSHVYCRKGTSQVLYEQDCKGCSTACLPYKTEKIKCSMCGQTACTCTDEDKALKRKTDMKKPHLSELCHRCQAGKHCERADY